jgi:polyphosphate kinase
LRTESVHTVCFAGGKPEFYIGSADWMTRNLMRRVEVVTPVIDESIKKELQVRTRGTLVLAESRV